MVEWLRFLREKKPRFAIYENVKNIVGARFRPTFDLFVKELEDYGIIKTDEPRTLDFSWVRGFLVTNVCIVQRSAAQNVHRFEPYGISSTVAFSSSKVL